MKPLVPGRPVDAMVKSIRKRKYAGVVEHREESVRLLFRLFLSGLAILAIAACECSR